MGNLQYLAMFMFLVFLPTVISRECYQCLSTHSWGDCDDKRIKVTCLGSTNCVKAKVYATSGSKDEAFVRGCAATCSASSIPQCNNAYIKCEVNCCSSDLCNGAAGPMVSGLLLIVAAYVVFVFGF